MSLPNCPKCQSEYTYQEADLFICPECAHEWKEGSVVTNESEEIIKAGELATRKALEESFNFKNKVLNNEI